MHIFDKTKDFTCLLKLKKKFTLLYVLIVGLELITDQIEGLNTFHFIAKPAIVISIIFFFTNQSQLLTKPLRVWVVLALVCSLLGDTLLMFVSVAPYYFMFGLIAFLLAHIMYIVIFLKDRNKSKSPLLFILLLLIYGSGLFYFLKDGLGALLVPVIIYMLVILTMAASAFLRKSKGNSLSYSLVFIGAISFMISDSILALNKFYEPLIYSSFSIMITYALAQYLIVLGILKLKL